MPIVIADATSNRFTIPANTTLAAGRALVIFGGGTALPNDPAFGGALVLALTGSGTLSLNDTGDTVNGWTPRGEPVDLLGVSVLEMQGDLIREERVYWDGATLLAGAGQIG